MRQYRSTVPLSPVSLRSELREKYDDVVLGLLEPLCDGGSSFLSGWLSTYLQGSQLFAISTVVLSFWA